MSVFIIALVISIVVGILASKLDYRSVIKTYLFTISFGLASWTLFPIIGTIFNVGLPSFTFEGFIAGALIDLLRYLRQKG